MWPKRVFLAFLKFGPKSCISALFYCPKSYLHKNPGRVRAGPGFTFLSPGRAGPAFIFILLSPGRAGFKNVGQCRPLFRTAFSNEWAEKKDGKFILRKPNISSRLFNIILM